ncbi:Helicase ATP-binding domain-containing protein [Aphelenchoides fujianensis]|nr:Helicase ATP-binding domain-containing protein [Aphelenchoides fujianensis]
MSTESSQKEPKCKKWATDDELRSVSTGGSSSGEDPAASVPVPNGFARPHVFGTAAPPKRHPAFAAPPLPRAPGDLAESSGDESEPQAEAPVHDRRRRRPAARQPQAAAPARSFGGREARREAPKGGNFAPSRPTVAASRPGAFGRPSLPPAPRPRFAHSPADRPPASTLRTRSRSSAAPAAARASRSAPVAAADEPPARPPTRRSDFADLCKLEPVDWSAVQLAPVAKHFYEEQESVKTRSEEETRKWISQHRVLLHGIRVPRPILRFSEAGFPPVLVEQLEARFEAPTVVQGLAWPLGGAQRAGSRVDRAHGLGQDARRKLAFLLPAIVHIQGQTERQARDGPAVLVLSPTRELAQQVADVARDFCRSLGLKIACLYGGGDKIRQRSDMRFGVDLCIATPGRFLEFLREGTVQLARCSYVVLDEADRMLELGYDAQLRSIIGQTRPDRQTLMFSATWPAEVRSFAKRYQQTPVFMNVGPLEVAANANIEQNVEVLRSDEEKRARLRALLTQLAAQGGKAIKVPPELKEPQVLIVHVVFAVAFFVMRNKM